MPRIPLGWAFGALLVSLAGFASAQIYTWTDAEGNKIYSDLPHPGARKIDLPPANTVDITTPQTSVDQTGSANQNEDRQDQLANGYTTLQIISPDDDEAVRANDGNVTLVVNTDPPLLPGHVLRANVDGQLREEAVAGSGQTTQRLTLRELDRGAHDIVAVVTNSRGEVVDRSQGVTVYVKRTSILQPGRTGANAAPQAPQMPAAGNPAP